jgi:Asp-tRNA(Asn)/Glu-tRNA(Gln) amidotransferase A subunit family amidase
MSEQRAALNELGAADAARKLARREISAEQLVKSCLDRIVEREPLIEAWAHIAFDDSLEQARALDRGAVRGLLHGLPIGVKDLFDTAGMPTSYGSSIYARHRPAADAAAVALACEAGAIVLGKTVTTEFATFHPGKTRNPHNPDHTPGGSSSGSAAAVADRMVPLALGTQTAGSVIRPAAFCGIVGFKPSLGRIPRAGLKDLSDTLDTVGVFGRSVEDAALFAAALLSDERLLDLRIGAPPRIGICRTFDWPHADKDTQAAMELAIRLLSQAGAPIAEAALPASFAGLARLQADIMEYEEARSFAHERRCHAGALSSSLAAILRAGGAIGAAQHEANRAAVNRARQMADAGFDGVDVLLAPSTVGAAPAGLQSTGNPLFCRMWTLLGLPCVHLPFARAANGMPVGLQLVGRFDDDRRTLQAAQWVLAVLTADAS